MFYRCEQFTDHFTKIKTFENWDSRQFDTLQKLSLHCEDVKERVYTFQKQEFSVELDGLDALLCFSLE